MILNPVRSGQVRKAIKSSKMRPPPPFYVHFTRSEKYCRKRDTPKVLGDERPNIGAYSILLGWVRL
jgi:hypothetical protein